MLKKAKKKQEKMSRTKLIPVNENPTQWISTTYSDLSKSVEKVFKKFTEYNVSYKTKNNLKSKLENPKDKINFLNKSGIYEIKCDDCDKTYIGQTKRAIKTRFKEHAAHIKFNRPEKSAVAGHCILNGHSISEGSLKILKSITSTKYLNPWETYFINLKNENDLMNTEDGPIPNSILLKKKL